MARALLTVDDSHTDNNTKHLELFSLIWLDPNANSTEIKQTEQKLRSVINLLKKFQNIKECQQYIEQTSQHNRLVIIVNGQLGFEIVPSIHKLRQVISIYIYCMNKKKHKEWSCKFIKVKGVITDLDELISCIETNHKIEKKLEEPLSINVFVKGTSTKEMNGEFIFSQILIDCLLQLKSTETDKSELINLCKNQYEGNSIELNNIREFEHNYKPQKTLWWYTKESFFYKTLNAALRKPDIHTIFLFRSFICDIHRQLREYQSKDSLRVYRGQMISNDELKILQKNIGQLISINSFFSTTIYYAKAISFLDASDFTEGLEKVLFEINANPNMVTTKPFANISKFSEFTSEAEVLFMLGSIFQLENIDRNENQIWVIQMKLCNDDEHYSKEVLINMKQKIGDKEPNLQTLGRILWNMGKLDLAEKYFIRLSKELPDDNPLLCSLYEDLGKIASQMGKFNMSVEWHQKSIEHKKKHQPSNISTKEAKAPTTNQHPKPQEMINDNEIELIDSDVLLNNKIECTKIDDHYKLLTTTKTEVNSFYQLHPTKSHSSDQKPFLCSNCNRNLSGLHYILKNKFVYCIKCYEDCFANTCEECQHKIGTDSKDLSYKEQHWHEKCFFCSSCKTPLIDKPFGYKNGQILCGECYNHRFASRCDKCLQIFKPGSKKLEHRGQQFHEHCFTCYSCLQNIGTKSFIPKDKKSYCVSCYEKCFATKCIRCFKVISQGGVTYKKQPWHRECFICTGCKKSLAGERFTSRDDHCYCADCFARLFAKRCFACSKAITGVGGTRYISFEDRHWHNECFICHRCRTSLLGRGFLQKGLNIFCPDCSR